MRLNLGSIKYRRFFDGEGGNNPATPPEPPKTFTQADVDNIVQTRVKKEKERAQKLADDLEQIKGQANLSEEHKTALQAQIDELQNSLLTKEQLADQEKKKFEAQHQKVTAELTADRDKYRDLYTSTTIKRAILDAAIANEAAVPGQLVTMLTGAARLAEVKGADGKPTGEHEPFVKVSGRDKDNKPVVLDLPVLDAVKQMKEWPDLYGNLFKDTKTGGVGATTTGQGSSVNPNNVSSMSDWKAVRKQMGMT